MIRPIVNMLSVIAVVLALVTAFVWGKVEWDHLVAWMAVVLLLSAALLLAFAYAMAFFADRVVGATPEADR